MLESGMYTEIGGFYWRIADIVKPKKNRKACVRLFVTNIDTDVSAEFYGQGGSVQLALMAAFDKNRSSVGSPSYIVAVAAVKYFHQKLSKDQKRLVFEDTVVQPTEPEFLLKKGMYFHFGGRDLRVVADTERLSQIQVQVCVNVFGSEWMGTGGNEHNALIDALWQAYDREPDEVRECKAMAREIVEQAVVAAAPAGKVVALPKAVAFDPKQLEQAKADLMGRKDESMGRIIGKAKTDLVEHKEEPMKPKKSCADYVRQVAAFDLERAKFFWAKEPLFWWLFKSADYALSFAQFLCRRSDLSGFQAQRLDRCISAGQAFVVACRDLHETERD